LLANRATISAVDAIEHLIGLQAQAPYPPYFGLWTRLEGFQPDDLARLILDRSVVRIVLMRSTIHLVSARDSLMLRPLLQPVQERAFMTAYGRLLDGLDRDEIAAVGRALCDETPRTFRELGALLQVGWPDRDSSALAQAIRAFVPLVQVPPRGIWGQGGEARHTSVEAWLGEPLDPAPDLLALVRRYLAAFGPATVLDMQKWSGLNGLRAAFERLRPKLRTFQDEQGRELFDLPGAPLPDPETPIPPRFVAEFDNVLLSHADRTRIIAEEHRPRVLTVNGIVRGTILLDGFVGAVWKIGRERVAATLVVEPFVPLTASDRELIADEGDRLLAFAAPDVRARDIQFAVTD
jgi:hypothetical protein